MISRLLQLLNEVNIVLTEQQQQLLLCYIDMLYKWNKIYNLTAVRDKEQMLIRHIMDSIVVEPYLKGNQFIDVGTGAGLPGIPLAIIRENSHFTLLDSLGKRVRFLRQVECELGLKNITLAHSRVEKYFTSSCFDGVISRAFATLSNMTNGCQHLLKENGVFYALKGCYPKDEIAELSQHISVTEIILLQVPSLNADRHLITIKCNK